MTLPDILLKYLPGYSFGTAENNSYRLYQLDKVISKTVYNSGIIECVSVEVIVFSLKNNVYEVAYLILVASYNPTSLDKRDKNAFLNFCPISSINKIFPEISISNNV